MRIAVRVPGSGAELVATDCPGCIMQLQDSINHADGGQRTIHILELLAEALPDPDWPGENDSIPLRTADKLLE